jgi:signal transduction histidine kinase
MSRLCRTRDVVSAWLDSLPDATLVASPNGVVLMANHRAVEMARAAVARSTQPIAGRPVADVLRELTSSHRASSFAERALYSLRDAQEGGMEADAALNQGIEVVDAAGRSLFIKCAPTRSMHRDSRNLVFHISDVTQLRAAERQRDIALRFLSHDMRSPQAAIVALVEHRRQFPSDMPEPKFLDLIGQYASSSLTLADDFLFLAHAESRPPQLVLADVALLLGDAVDDTWFQAREKQTEVRLSAEPGMTVSADVRLLRRAFANLIGNAIKYSPQCATVEIVVEDMETNWKIAVIDYGIGISPDHVPHLFGEFVRLGDDNARPGHGLGLAFVKSVVDALGGHIDVHCRDDGTTFAVLLPKATDVDPQPDAMPGI